MKQNKKIMNKKKYQVMVTLPVFFNMEVEVDVDLEQDMTEENCNKILDKFDFAEAIEIAEYKLRNATYIQICDEEVNQIYKEFQK